MRMRFATLLLAAGAVLAAALPAGALTVTPGSPGVSYAINDYSGTPLNGFYVNDTGFAASGATAQIQGDHWHLNATGTGYSDAGIVLGFDGPMKLGNVSGVVVNYTGGPLGVNLWFDTGGDGKFFAFSGSMLTGLAGDSYGGTNSIPVTDASVFYMFGGKGAGQEFTLAQLKAGQDSGIDANTAVALWIGVTNGGGSDVSADIASVTVVPEPLTMLGVAMGLGSLGAYIRRRTRAVAG